MYQDTDWRDEKVTSVFNDKNILLNLQKVLHKFTESNFFFFKVSFLSKSIYIWILVTKKGCYSYGAGFVLVRNEVGGWGILMCFPRTGRSWCRTMPEVTDILKGSSQIRLLRTDISLLGFSITVYFKTGARQLQRMKYNVINVYLKECWTERISLDEAFHGIKISKIVQPYFIL